MFRYLLSGLSLGFYAALSPGPFQAFLLAQSVKHGWRRTLPASLAPLFSDGPIVALVLLVLTQTPGWLLDGLRLAGGVFILYLAWDALSAARKGASPAVPPPETGGRSLGKAVVMNLLNPNPYLFWGVVAGPILLEGWQQAPRLGLGFVVSFYGMLVGGLAGLIVLFATARHLGPKVTRGLEFFSAGLLAIFGVYQVWLGVQALF
ncbi:MAG: LysE family translocator [Caldilineae bacterium]|nr:MAG: LysE family translocator [Caldilineae bacterium]